VSAATPLRGRVALVTGAAHGLGREHARRLAAQGARVAVVDIDGPAAEAVAAELPGALAVAADITRSGPVESAVAATVARLGGLDIVVNNAGGARGYVDGGSPERAFRETLDLNLTGTWLVCAAAVPRLRARGGGRIVNTTSNTALRPPGDVPLAYVAAKAGVIGLTRALARELGPHGITVNAIAPGLTPHDGVRARIPAGELGAMTARAVAEQCVPRPATPADISAALLYLVSEAASFVTGQVLAVDGGWTFGN
jgi:NAD(P)-dependent dehydrogenase (short-subunit alcohol dehydrogenase family)